MTAEAFDSWWERQGSEFVYRRLLGHNVPRDDLRGDVYLLCRKNLEGYDEARNNASLEGWVNGKVLNAVRDYVIRKGRQKRPDNHLVRFYEPPHRKVVTVDEPDFTFTAGEGKVLVELAKGSSREEIASTLGISVRTVQFHIDQMRKRLGLRGKRGSHDVSLIKAGLRLGIVQMEDLLS